MEHKTITAVGIDVSKGKSTVAVRRPGGEVVLTPFQVEHDAAGLSGLVKTLRSISGDIRVVMEHTGMYWRPIALALKEAGFFVSVVNAMLIHDFSDNSLRKVKTDKADSVKIAKYAMSFWVELRDYSPEDETRRIWCTRSGYHFSRSDAEKFHTAARNAVAAYPQKDSTKLLVAQAVDSLNAVYDALYILRGEMLRLASLLPEFDIVMAMQGAGEVTGPQLMAEIGDVRRFTHKGALVAFAGMDAPPFQSGIFDSKSRRISKRGSPHLRKTLFMVASTILQHSDPDNPIFQFMDKKQAEGKHFYIYIVAGAAKFLRTYYARVNAHLAMLGSGANTAA